MASHWSDVLVRMRACSEAVEYARTQPDFATAWQNCERPDWMFWIAGCTNSDKKQIVRAACAIARAALQYIPDAETRPLTAIEITERWCRGEDITTEQLRTAAAASAAASAAAATWAASAAASAAAATWAATRKEQARIIREHITIPLLGDVK